MARCVRTDAHMLLLSPNKRLVPSLPRAWLSTFPFVLTLGCGICECECNIKNNYWHTAQNSVSARLRLGRVGFADSQAAAAERSGQRFLDTVYAASGRTEGFKGGTKSSQRLQNFNDYKTSLTFLYLNVFVP